VIPQKSLILGTNSREFLENFSRNQLQEMILEKFLGNSLKKVTTVGESGEIPHFFYDCLKTIIFLKAIVFKKNFIDNYVNDRF